MYVHKLYVREKEAYITTSTHELGAARPTPELGGIEIRLQVGQRVQTEDQESNAEAGKLRPRAGNTQEGEGVEGSKGAAQPQEHDQHHRHLLVPLDGGLGDEAVLSEAAGLRGFYHTPAQQRPG